MIVAFGIPGSGKSSVMKCLGKMLKAKTFHEPEEKSWSAAVQNRQLSGNFTAITWFRSMRVPMLFLGQQLRNKGKLVLIDSYYDKLFHLYISKNGIQWLFEKSDEYYDEMKLIAAKDYQLLPNADCIIFFKVSRTTWKQFLNERNRKLDNDESFQKKCFESQEPFLEAAEKYCEERNCDLVIFEQHFSNPEQAAKELLIQINEKISLKKDD